MLFNSLTFIFLFFPIVVLLYFCTKNIKIKNALLLVASLIFYSWGEPQYIILMLLTVLVAYIFGILIHKNANNKKSKIYLIISIILVLSSLFIFKYLDFSVNIFNNIFSTDINNLNPLLPIGISFYTFQTLSYIIDLYKKEVKLQKNYFRLLLYVSFFPQLIAGPIVRYDTIEKELTNRHTSMEDFAYGIKRFILGLSKKIIIANNAALLCDSIYSNYTGYGANILWLAAIAYAVQIYFDFSGYSDMAIGLGRIFGFHFLENFNYPYIAKSVTDFWRRWHISLSTFFRDYIYIPLGGNRKGTKKQIRNILIVWLLTGLWHGANYNFIFWGLYYGLLLILEKFVLKKFLDKMPSFVQHLYAIFTILIGWVIFRVEAPSDLLNILGGMFSFSFTGIKDFFINNMMLVSTIPYLILGLIFSTPLYTKIFKNSNTSIVKTLIEDGLLIALFAICIIFLVSSQYNPFIYFRF